MQFHSAVRNYQLFDSSPSGHKLNTPCRETENGAPAKNRAARFCGEKEAQQNEREVTFAKKVVASDMMLATKK